MRGQSDNPILSGNCNKDFGIRIGQVSSVLKDDRGRPTFIVTVEDNQSGITGLKCKISGLSFNPRTKEGLICIPSIGTKVVYTMIGTSQGIVLGSLAGTVDVGDVTDEPSSNPGFENFLNFDGAEGDLPSDGGFEEGDKGFINGPTSKVKLKKSGLLINKSSVNNWEYRVPGEHKNMKYCWWLDSRQPGQVSIRRSHLSARDNAFSAAYRRDDIFVNPTLKNFLVRDESGFLDDQTLQSTNYWEMNEPDGWMGNANLNASGAPQRGPTDQMPVKRWKTGKYFADFIENAREEHRYDGSYGKRYGSEDGKIFNCTESQYANGTRRLSIGLGGTPVFDMEIDHAGNVVIMATSLRIKTTQDFSVHAGTDIHTYATISNKIHAGTLVEAGGQFNSLPAGQPPVNPILIKNPHLIMF